MTTVAFVSPCAATSSTHGSSTKCAISAAGSVAVAITSRSRNVSRPRRTLPASETSTAAGCARSASTTSRTTGRPCAEQAAPLGLRAEALGERLEDLLLALRAEPLERSHALLLRRLAQPVERRDPELAPDPGGGLRAETGQPQELRHLVGHLGAPLLERGHLAGLGELDDLRLDRRADPGSSFALPASASSAIDEAGLADPRRGAPVGEHAEALLTEDLGDVGEQRRTRPRRPRCEAARAMRRS